MSPTIGNALPAGRLDLGRGREHRAGQLRVGLGGLGDQRDVGAVAGGPQRDLQADAAAAAGDEQGLVPKAHAKAPIPVMSRPTMSACMVAVPSS